MAGMTSGEERPVATSRTAIPVRYRVVLGSLGFAAAAGSVIAALEEGPGLLAMGLLMAAVFAPVMMMTARIEVGEQGVRIRVAAIFSTEIRYREITGVSAGPVTGLREGMGLRILPDGTGYLVGGPSVRIECGGTAVLVSCSDPGRLLDAVAPRLGTAPGG